MFHEATRSIRPFDTSKNFEAEYFLASDASAIIEHTNQVLYLEDDDVAVIESGRKLILINFLKTIFIFS